jgi:hypothetical protein
MRCKHDNNGKVTKYCHIFPQKNGVIFQHGKSTGRVCRATQSKVLKKKKDVDRYRIASQRTRRLSESGKLRCQMLQRIKDAGQIYKDKCVKKRRPSLENVE